MRDTGRANTGVLYSHVCTLQTPILYTLIYNNGKYSSQHLFIFYPTLSTKQHHDSIILSLSLCLSQPLCTTKEVLHLQTPGLMPTSTSNTNRIKVAVVFVKLRAERRTWIKAGIASWYFVLAEWW